MCEFAVDPGLPDIDLRNRVGRNLERIRAQNDEVGPFADRDAAQFCFASERACAVERVSLKSLVGSDAESVGAELVSLTRHASDGCLNRLERLGFGNGSVGADGHGYLGGDELAERVEPLTGGSDCCCDALAPVVVVLRLVHRVDTG